MRKNRMLWAVLGILALLVAVPLVLHVARMDLSGLEHYKDQWLVAVPILVGLYLLKSVTVVLLPQPVVYIAAGLLFSPVPALAVTAGCLLLEFTWDYLFARRFAAGVVDRALRWAAKRVRPLDSLMRSGSLNTVGSIALLRLLPGISTDAVSLFAGTRRVDKKPYYLGSLLGCAPQAVTVTLMGSAVGNPSSPAFYVPLIVLAATLGATLGGRWIQSRRDPQPND